MDTKKLSCTCASNYQDKLYGNGVRVHNPMQKDRHLVGWRCTVCGTKKSPSKGDSLDVNSK